MDLKTRKRLSLLVLLVWMPLYIVAVVSLMGWIERQWGRPPFLVELLVYVVLGVLWVVPFRKVFLGVGR